MTKKQIYEFDSKRRITFPKDIQEKYGGEFAIVRLRDEILLKPMPKNPVKTLQEQGKKLRGLNAVKLRKDFEAKLMERV